MTTYRVAAGTQVNVGGVVYADGETFDVDDSEPLVVAEPDDPFIPTSASPLPAWLAAGLIEAVADKPAAKARTRRPK